jgi:hypothetical protein
VTTSMTQPRPLAWSFSEVREEDEGRRQCVWDEIPSSLAVIDETLPLPPSIAKLLDVSDNPEAVLRSSDGNI